METFKVAMYNVRGLRDNNKRKQVMHYLHIKNYDIVFVQEAHGCNYSEKIWSANWGRKIWFSHGDMNARGVAILFKRNLEINVHNIINDKEGRYVILYVTMFKQKWVLASVYAPNEDKPEFFQKLFKDLHCS